MMFFQSMSSLMHSGSKTPAQLWIGTPKQLNDEVELHIQKIFCAHGGCSVCALCLQIRQRQFHNCMWFNPSGTYTLDMLKPFFATISRSLMPGQKFYFIFHNADYLSHACANSLLKSIEEPPKGYHIIFLAQQLQSIISTVRSRCTLVYMQNNGLDDENSDLVSFFTKKRDEPELFMQTLEKTNLSEQAVTAVINQTLAYWCAASTEAIKLGMPTDDIMQKLDCIKHLAEKPPMPGSAKIFLKNLFLHCNY